MRRQRLKNYYSRRKHASRSFGSAVLELLAEKGITGVLVKRLGIHDEFVNHATQAQQRDTYGINEEGIILAIREMLLKE